MMQSIDDHLYVQLSHYALNKNESCIVNNNEVPILSYYSNSLFINIALLSSKTTLGEF
jgi:hypothetical protein